jgi:Transposase DNA-binding
LEGIELGDERRAKRARTIVERLAESPEASLPVAMGDSAAIEALYRHLGGDGVGLEAILRPHVAKTVDRVSREETVYAVADTTDFVFSGKAEREGLGRVHDDGSRGFLAHLTLAVAADRTPLGLIGVETWTRTERKSAPSSTARRKDTSRESLRWARGMRQASARVGNAARKLVHVADREGDIFDLLVELVQAGHRFIIRAAQDRVVAPMERDDATHLFEAAQTTAPAFELEVPLSARSQNRWPDKRRTFPARRQRTARLSFAARTVALRRPVHGPATLPKTLSVNIVHVFELAPPTGEAAVEWLLLTSEPIETNEHITKIVEGYRARWVVEEYFKAVKTGCAFESRQLESADTLQSLLAYTLIVAYALLLMRALSRQNRDEPAENLLSPAQLFVLRAKVKRLSPELTVREALLAVAGMGGHLKNNGDPGWRTLSKGWAKLLALEEGYELARSLAAK